MPLYAISCRTKVFDFFLKSCDVPGSRMQCCLDPGDKSDTKRLSELLVIIKRLLNLSHGARDLKRERNIYVTYLKTLLRGDLIKYGKKLTILHSGGSKISFGQEFSWGLERKINHEISCQQKCSKKT